MATSSNRLSCSGVVFVFDLFVWPIRTNFFVYIVIILRTPASRATPSDHCRDENMSRINKKLMQGRSVSVIFTDPTMYHSLYSVSYRLSYGCRTEFRWWPTAWCIKKCEWMVTKFAESACIHTYIHTITGCQLPHATTITINGSLEGKAKPDEITQELTQEANKSESGRKTHLEKTTW